MVMIYFTCMRKESRDCHLKREVQDEAAEDVGVAGSVADEDSEDVGADRSVENDF